MKKIITYLVSVFIILGLSSCKNEKNPLSDVFPMPVPSMNWGEPEKTIKEEMKDLGYRLVEEGRGEGGSYMEFSYDHDRYEVDCNFIESQYAFFGAHMGRSEALNVIEWLDENYKEDDFLRFEGGRAYMYLSKDGKMWVYAEIDDEDRYYYFAWGSMKFAASIYDMLLEDFR